MNQQRRSKLVYSLHKFLATALLILSREQAPFGTPVIEREIDELSGKLRLLYLHFGSRRRKPKGTARGIAWILITTHCFYL